MDCRIARVRRIRGSWVVILDDRPVASFPGEREAVVFAVRWVLDHPGTSMFIEPNIG